jgi:hypothetical protein
MDLQVVGSRFGVHGRDAFDLRAEGRYNRQVDDVLGSGGVSVGASHM